MGDIKRKKEKKSSRVKCFNFVAFYRCYIELSWRAKTHMTMVHYGDNDIVVLCSRWLALSKAVVHARKPAVSRSILKRTDNGP